MAIISTLGFVFWRFFEIITLIPTMGMLAYFVNGYVNNNLLTPNYILILFIVSVLALAWAIFTLFSYHRSSSSARFVALIDLCFVGAFIAAVYYLRFIGGADCTHIVSGDSYDVSFGIFGNAYGNTLGLQTDKTCAMLKASWAFAIMNCIFFFFSAVFAFLHGDRAAKDTRYRRESHYSRTGGRRRSGSGSHHSRTRTSHSRRRYVV